MVRQSEVPYFRIYKAQQRSDPTKQVAENRLLLKANAEVGGGCTRQGQSECLDRLKGMPGGIQSAKAAVRNPIVHAEAEYITPITMWPPVCIFPMGAFSRGIWPIASAAL
jgi:hypothetical protein